ncbi:hypothetical protein BDY19DRAFT_926007 [Irpex rosettiformis]|uniref:Uncharacterized protein n=1 Tax=Irpex rosettiformis TaxID=378272 RepID=A0ACB8UER6_9APHY|nr:hypothetical protein BDY19DRAFT_926007 [Irpex rosettiformis]
MSLAHSSLSLRRHVARSRITQSKASSSRTTLHSTWSKRFSSTGGDAQGKQPSAHASFYSDMVPGMVPIALLGSAIFLGLRLLQGKLSHERYLDEATARVAELEREVETLLAQRSVEAAAASPSSPVSDEASSKKHWFW